MSLISKAFQFCSLECKDETQDHEDALIQDDEQHNGLNRDADDDGLGGPVVGTQGVNGNGSNSGIDGSDGVRGGVVRRGGGGRGGRGAMAYYSRKRKSADPSLHHYGELVVATMILKDIGFDLEKLIISLSKESARFEEFPGKTSGMLTKVLVNVSESTSDDQVGEAAEVLTAKRAKCNLVDIAASGVLSAVKEGDIVSCRRSG